MNRLRSKPAIVLGVLVVIAACIFIFRGQLLRFGAAKIVGSATGTQASFGSIALHGGKATITGVRLIGHGGEQLAYVPRIEVGYNLRDLLPGSTHRYGLRWVTVYHPQITVIHNPDGTYNLPKLPKAAPSNRAATPMNAAIRVVDGSITILDRTRVDPSARRLYVDNVNIQAAMHTAARSTYTASMAYVNGGSYPIRGAGVIDAPAGFTLHHWTAAHVPLPQLVNYALNNANIRMQAGYLDNLDARYYGGISASAYMRGAQVSMQGVSEPIRNVHGPLDVTGAGLTTSGLTAAIAGTPLHVSGGIYDLKAPKFRLAVHANADLTQLKHLTASAAKLPVRGPVDLALLVEGAVRTPLALISLRSPRIEYRAMPLQNAQGSIAFDGKTASVLNFAVSYGGFGVDARGRIALQKEPHAVEAVATVNGSSAGVPYAPAIVPDMPLYGTLLATGDDLRRIDTHGVLAGAGSGNRLASVFSVSSDGVGRVDLNLQSDDSPAGLRARVALDRPHGTLAALVHANDLTIRPAQVAALPGLDVKGPPPVSGTITGDIFASQRGNRLGMRGNVDVRDAAYSGISIAQAHARFAGVPGDIGVSSLAASGSFGTLQAAGTISGTNHIALQGRLHGSLAALGSLAGHLPASGTVDAPIALVYDRGVSVAQVRNAQFSGASIRGVPIDDFSATLGTRGKNVHVYAARATIAHTASAVASGSLDNGAGNVALSVAHLNLAALHGAGLPLEAGYADVAATASGSLTAPAVDGALVLEGARYARYPVSGDTAFAYSGDTLRVRDGTIDMGPAVVALDGSIAGIRMGAPLAPRYDLSASSASCRRARTNWVRTA